MTLHAPIRVGLIGGGFCGTLTAYHLLKNAQSGQVAFDVTVIDEKAALGKGKAYAPSSPQALLNVIAGKMSAFPDQPDHFLDWVMRRPEYAGKDASLVANAFLPRALYGAYLGDVWSEARAMAAEPRAGGNLSLRLVDDHVVEMRDVQGPEVKVRLRSGAWRAFDFVVLATGNALPRNPSTGDPDVWKDPRYFRNPWQPAAVSPLASEGSGVRAEDGPVLILGSGLTMVDTVLGLLENGYRGEIVSLSPHGFDMLPHRHGGFKYTGLVETLPLHPSLSQTVTLLLKHVRKLREFGISPEPVIDSLRPRTQALWRSFSLAEKRRFMQHCRHLWGVARHRIPVQMHDRLQQLRLAGRLTWIAGRMVDARMDLRPDASGLAITYRERGVALPVTRSFARIINCTGPETDFSRDREHFLYDCVSRGDLAQDPLRLGLHADPETFEVFGADGASRPRVLTLGPNLRGALWESTAVNELRDQARRLGERLATRQAQSALFRQANPGTRAAVVKG